MLIHPHTFSCCLLTLQLQEQLTLKPSLAKKLNERIRSLEIELEITRNESRVDELERKVAVRLRFSCTLDLMGSDL